MPEKSAEDLAARLMAVDLQLQREFARVSYPDDDVFAQKRSAKYIEVIRAWQNGS